MVGLVALVLVPDPPASARAHASKAEPLQVVLTSISPSAVPRSGPLRLTGTVRNTSDETWRTVNMSTIASTSPMTTSQQLAQAARTPVDSYVGSRFSSPHSFVAVGDLDPGDSASFSLRIPRSELPISDVAGVYWIGVQALATNDDGRDVQGRARTFIPLVKGPRSAATVSVVLPLRQEVRQSLDLRVANAGYWRSLLAPGGRLGRLLSLTESSGTAPVTLLLDPALLEAVQTLGAGNPSRRTTQASPGASSSPSTDGDGQGEGAQGSSGTADETSDTASVTARDWLARLQSQAQAPRNRVLDPGYADPDVAALSRHVPDLLEESTSLGETIFDRLGIDSRPALAPADGLLPSSALDTLEQATTDQDPVVLLSDEAPPRSDNGSGPRRAAPSGAPIVLADSAASGGGPSPGPTTSALAERQRIVSEAALRAQAGDRDPLVVSLPADWDPGPDWQDADFFGGLDRPWLSLMPLDTSGGAATLRSLRYPASAARAELGQQQLAAIRSLRSTSDRYVDTLTRPAATAQQLQHLVLESASYHTRGDATAPARARALTAGLDDRLARVKVVGSDFATLSGGSGSIVVTLVNDLDQTARIGVAVRSSSDLRITAPGPVTLLPGQRTTVPLSASSENNGVRAVVVTPVTPEGQPIGTPMRFSVRSSQVSLLVWGVIGAGGLLLVVMIVRRAIRRGLHRERPTT